MKANRKPRNWAPKERGGHQYFGPSTMFWEALREQDEIRAALQVVEQELKQLFKFVTPAWRAVYLRFIRSGGVTADQWYDFMRDGAKSSEPVPQRGLLRLVSSQKIGGRSRLGPLNKRYRVKKRQVKIVVTEGPDAA